MPFAIGCLSLSGWEKAVSAEYDVYSALIAETRITNNGMVEERTVYALVSQPMDDEVHYCRMIVGSEKLFVGDTPKVSAAQVAETAWKLITEWLEERGHHWHEAVVGTPKDVNLLNGHADFLKYEPEAKTWKRVDR